MLSPPARPVSLVENASYLGWMLSYYYYTTTSTTTAMYEVSASLARMGT